jgi:hypothetical protein
MVADVTDTYGKVHKVFGNYSVSVLKYFSSTKILHMGEKWWKMHYDLDA